MHAQAYATMNGKDATDYRKVETAIYPEVVAITSVKMYKRRFRTAKKKEGETYEEMVIQLGDLVKKWMTDCETVQEGLEKLVVEQLMHVMLNDQKVWCWRGSQRPEKQQKSWLTTTCEPERVMEPCGDPWEIGRTGQENLKSGATTVGRQVMWQEIVLKDLADNVCFKRRST